MSKIEVTLSAPQGEVFESRSQITLFLAGIGSGKSHLAGLISYDFISKYPKAKGFIAANTHNQLNTSTLSRVISVWKSLGLKEEEDFVINKQPPIDFITENHSYTEYRGIISFRNGHIIFIGSLENAKAHDGKEFDYAFLDETKDSKESDVKEIILGRLRGSEIRNNPLYILTSPAKVQWLNEWFNLEKYKLAINEVIFDKNKYFTVEESGKKIVICSTYHNQDNLPEDYIEKIYQNNTEERAKALIYGNPFFTVGGEYFSSFSQIENVKNFDYRDDMPLHISFDQNVIPYTPAGIFQIDIQNREINVYMIDEIAMFHPNNTTEHVCREILRRYGNHRAGVYIYGDATGNARKGMTANVKNHYDIIKKVLRPLLSNRSMRVAKFNEQNLKRREFMNMCFEGKLSFNFYLNENCTYTKKDFMYIVQDVNGLKKKEKDKDGAEKYGHFSDLTEYFLISAFKQDFKNLNL